MLLIAVTRDQSWQKLRWFQRCPLRDQDGHRGPRQFLQQYPRESIEEIFIVLTFEHPKCLQIIILVQMLANHLLVVAVHYCKTYQIVLVAVIGHQVVYRATVSLYTFLSIHKKLWLVLKLIKLIINQINLTSAKGT